jgi:hypothetical protein
MTVRTFILTAGFLGLFIAQGCTSKTSSLNTADIQEPRKSYTEEAEGQSITSAAAKAADAKSFIEVEFNQGSSTLTNEAQDRLHAFVRKTSQQNVVKEVIVLSWSDDEYPSKQRKKLSQVQVNLADKRNAEIRKFINEINSIPVEAYNMAQQPGVVSSFFKTKDSKLKNSLVSAGLPTTADELQYPSKARHAIVMVKVE